MLDIEVEVEEACAETEAAERTCVTCCEVYPSQDSFPSLNCCGRAHKSCYTCLETHIKARLSLGTYVSEVFCPA